VSVTFSPSGVVTSAIVDGGAFPVTAVGSCISIRFRGTRVPAFEGGPVTVGRSFFVQPQPGWSQNPF
jgi:hypothetical protein